MKEWKAELYLLLVTAIWGGTFTFTKLGLADSPPFLYMTFRFVIALSIISVLFGPRIIKLSRETTIHGIVLGLLFGSGFILQTFGLKLTTVSKSAFITGITVVITPFVFYLVERKQVRFWSKIGVVIATIGLWLFTKPDFDHLNLGDVVTLLSCVFWAIYITYMDVFTRGKEGITHTLQLVFMQFLVSLSLSIIAFLIFETDGLKVNFTSNLGISLAYNGILASFMVTLIHTRYQRYTTPVKAALIFSLEPVVATIVAIFFLGELLNSREYVGGSILLIGVLTSELGGYIFKKH